MAPAPLPRLQPGQVLTPEQIGEYDRKTRLNGIRWIDCAAKVVQHIKEEQNCTTRGQHDERN